MSEDLPRLAAEAFRLSRSLCGPCQNYHSLWTYQRIVGASGGDVGTPEVNSVLGRLLSFPGREVLIAGSADTGLLASVLDVAQSDCRIVVLDQCETPLKLCRQLGERLRRQITTLKMNLTQIPFQEQFDVILAHSLLQYIAAKDRLEALRRMSRALRRPDGRLVLVFRTSDRIEGALLDEYRIGYAANVVDQLQALNIPLPESRDRFQRQVEIYAEERRAREGAHTSLKEIQELVSNAGLVVKDLRQIEAIQTKPFREFANKISKKRFLMVASPA
jgi:Methyltransferase domain